MLSMNLHQSQSPHDVLPLGSIIIVCTLSLRVLNRYLVDSTFPVVLLAWSLA